MTASQYRGVDAADERLAVRPVLQLDLGEHNRFLTQRPTSPWWTLITSFMTRRNCSALLS
jgi:hypothetical protein